MSKINKFCNIFHKNHSVTFRNKYVGVQNVKMMVNVPTLSDGRKILINFLCEK